MSRIVVFCGPTIGAKEVRALLPGADCRPPAAQGDLYAAAREQPAAIALIDGVFLDVPAVWHREILAALAEDVPVWGAASMGALRSVECAAFGMVGVGKIASAFASGSYPPFAEPFEDDDEVAVVHAPLELGAQPLSDAMVDLRESLARAEAAGVIDAVIRDRVAALLKALPFAERTFERLVEGATEGLRPAAAGRVAVGLNAYRCSQKREDALELLQRLAAAAPAPSPVSWRREQTVDWHRFAQQRETHPLAPDERAGLDSLKVDPALHRSVRRQAAARLIALQSIGSIEGAGAALLGDFRLDRGLLSRAALDGWLAANGLEEAALARLLDDEAALDDLAESVDHRRLDRVMLDLMRLDGSYSDLRTRILDEDNG